VPDNSTVVGVPGRVVRIRAEGGPLEHGRLPDPEGQAIDDLARRVAELEGMVRKLVDSGPRGVRQEEQGDQNNGGT
jgi:serine O-acetyltransferase